MPEALARTDHDFVLTQSPRQRRARKDAATSRLAWLRPLLRNPAQTVVGAASAAVAVGILLNAMAFQEGRHPAPFFAPAPAPAARVPTPPARPVALTGSVQSPAATAQAPATAAGLKQPTTTATVPVPQPRDPIGDLLKGGSPAEPSRAVLAAQRQLNKLGYGPVKPDGLFGLGTRQAIEKFERDRKLPVTGDLNARTSRDLAAAAGE